MNQNSIQQWSSYLEDIGIYPDLREQYIEYVKKCVRFGVPPIFERTHLSMLTGRHLGDLMSMIFATEKFYREFKLRKRSGGYRRILAPYPSLLEVQQWIKDNILSKYELQNCVTGFRDGYSIVDNARMHCGRDILIKIDIRDFFPSINFNQIMGVFHKAGYANNVCFYLSRLTTLDNQLPQGAATSPSLSNIVCRNMDKRFLLLSKNHRLRYTRYADDISISGKHISDGMIRLFFEIVESEGFRINTDKFRILNANDKKIVTGLDISSGRPRVTREFRRDLQRDIYFVWSQGLAAHIARRRIFFPNYVDHLTGRVNFWRSVEPESAQLKKVINRLKIIRSQYMI
ncbi:reverse transcriptase family protein [Brucella anthropi]|uniref:reverse transcriptase family protein n=1 Tax=Brucella anthropi TaxID=529 RepID=UPI00125E17E9|nr:reverse transcriptase family protein [Brucella anthropi]QFP63329.1 RNA-directed DNA polymerase [Brucella anthropi]